MPRFVLFCLALLAASASLAGEKTFAPSQSGFTEFTMPSGNIGCIYTPEGGSAVHVPSDGGPELSCDRVEPQYRRYVLSKEGPGVELAEVGDASCCSIDNILDYGDVWQEGPYRCESTRGGLICQTGQHGFFISRKNIELW